MGVALSSRQGEAAPSAVAGGAASRPLMVGPVTSVSMSTRGHSHMRGLVPQDGLFGGSSTGGSRNAGHALETRGDVDDLPSTGPPFDGAADAAPRVGA